MANQIPYSRQSIDTYDIEAVVEALKSDWLTTGPMVERFEERLADYVGSRYAVAVSNGTAALHTALAAAGVGPGDEVIVPAMTFVATANAAVFQGATPVFCDVDPEMLLINPNLVSDLITSKTKAVIAVDYTGQPCDYERLQSISRENGLVLVADACHSLGGAYQGKRVGSLADLNAFSFHPAKHITTGEGGMVTTDNIEYATQMRQFRNHGITMDHNQRAKEGTWFYEMKGLGFNYRLSDVQCALGLSQLAKQPDWIARRQEIAHRYHQAFEGHGLVRPLSFRNLEEHAYHLYVVRVVHNRDQVFKLLRQAGIGVNVHYIPVHLHPFYRNNFKTKEGQCPVAEGAFREIMSLPMFPTLSDADQTRVIEAVWEAAGQMGQSLQTVRGVDAL